jgi:hypothetical protein
MFPERLLPSISAGTCRATVRVTSSRLVASKRLEEDEAEEEEGKPPEEGRRSGWVEDVDEKVDACDSEATEGV